jgi:hypothetical protein
LPNSGDAPPWALRVFILVLLLGFPIAVVMAWMPAWDRYPAGWRNSPGMKSKLQAQGVVAYWRKHGVPPQCHAVGVDDFSCD